ncbi:MAG TPA: Sb-PDE family phosphodiesterase [Pseudomonadales bacterium]
MHRLLAHTVALLAIVLTAGTAWGHGTANEKGSIPGREIQFPDTADRLTLAVDLHTHSVFSDGHVWPRIRVSEAIMDGLDALAITEHLEWQPHLADIPHPDRNRAFEDAVASLPEGSDLILIAGSEITRLEPIGHMNAVFIQDANTLFQPPVPTEPYDAREYAIAAGEWPPEQALVAAEQQGAFVFWNHAWWQQANQIAVMTDFHRQAIKDKRLHGIEIANGDAYSPEAFQLALAHGLTPIGVSDVHELIDWDYPPHAGSHRPVNLVFAETRSAEAIRAALFDGRTVVWYRNLLIGRERDLLPLLTASIRAAEVSWSGESSVLEVVLENPSDAAFELENLSEHTLIESATTLVVPPHSRDTYAFRVAKRQPSVTLSFRVRNALIAPDAHPTLEFTLQPGG